MEVEVFALRDAALRRIRAFFHGRGFIEVETPVRIETPCMELHIDAEPSGDRFLRTSPEIFHKQLLARGMERIFEMGKCFRRGESGALHHPEYTMLEWYRARAGYLDVLDETRALLAHVWPDGPRDFKRMTVSECFRTYAGWDPAGAFDEDRFDLDLVEKVEPALRETGGPVFLVDYPAEAAALSRLRPDNPLLAERWELYIDGIELANAYSELADPVEQRRRFEQCAARRRALGKEVYGIDEAFVQALGRLPPCAGVALGVDRLVMLMAGGATLDAAMPFR